MLLLLAAVLTSVVLAGCATSQDQAAVTGVSSSDHDGYRGVKLDQPYLVPPVSLTDTEGHRFELATQSKRTLVFFGYTHCPDVCQIVMSTIASGIAKLPSADQAKVQVLFVTTDPARDTEKALRTYLDRFNPHFLGATGSLADINALGKPMGIDVLKGQKLPSGGYEVQHTTNVISVLGGKGDLVWTAATSPADISVDLEKILKADS
jgi:protein SCO1/2